MTEHVKILRPSLDDYERQTVLRGLVSPDTLENLKIDYYQRERLATSTRREIIRALDMGRRLPDIELGMRGDRFQVDDDGSIILVDKVFIIDGQQRRNTVLDHIARFPEDKVRLGAVVHFNTNDKWERERFHALNLYQSKVAPSVLLRNVKDESPFLATLYGLSKTQRDFAMYGRVCWTQNMTRGELITGLTFAQLAMFLHAHLAATRSIGVRAITGMSERVTGAVGLPLARANVTAFWELIDAAWGLRAVQYKAGASYLRGNFLRVLANMVSDHRNFWSQPDERRLVITPDWQRKFARFPVNDPEIVRLAGASGKARETLYFLLSQHLNSGKRAHRLDPRRAVVSFEDDSDTADALSA